MTDAQIATLIRPQLAAAFAAGRAKERAEADAAGARTFAAESDDSPQFRPAFTAADAPRFADYFADDAGAYAGSLHRHFGMGVREFADCTKLLRKQVLGEGGRAQWRWAARPGPAGPAAFAQDEQGHEHDASNGRFAPKGGGGAPAAPAEAAPPRDAARDEALADLESHDGGRPVAYHVDHADYEADFGFSEPAEIADRARGHIKEMLAEKDDYAARAIEYAGGGEALKTAYAEHRADLDAAAEGYKDALLELAESRDQAKEIKDELDATRASPLEPEDYGRPVKKPADPAKLPKWEAAMAEFQKNKAEAIAAAKAARQAEVADLKAKLQAPSERYKEAGRVARAAHRGMVAAGDTVNAFLQSLHAEGGPPRSFSDYEVFSEDFASFADRTDGETWETSGRYYKREAGRTRRLRNPNAADIDAAKKARGDAYRAANEGRNPREQLEHQKVQAEPLREAARAAFEKAKSEPSKLTADDIPQLAAHLDTLTRDELREHARASMAKLGGLKRDLVARLMEKVGAKPPGDAAPSPGKPADGAAAPSPTSADPAAAAKGPAGVWDAFKGEKDQGARDWLAVGLHNGGVTDPEGLKKPPANVDPDRLTSALAGAYQRAHKEGSEPGQRALAAALAHMGAEPSHAIGDVVPYDPARHDLPVSASVGTPVRVKVPGVRTPTDARLRNAGVELAPTPAPTASQPKRPRNPGRADDAKPTEEEIEAASQPAAAPKPSGAAKPAGAAKPTGAPPERVHAAIKDAIKDLKLFPEFEDGMVEIRRMYHEAKRTIPGLTVEQFHRELEYLQGEREVELHGLNEVQHAKEPELALRRNDRLLYYAMLGKGKKTGAAASQPAAAPKSAPAAHDIVGAYGRSKGAKHSEVNAAARAAAGMTRAQATETLKQMGYGTVGDPRRQLAETVLNRKMAQIRGTLGGSGAGREEDQRRAAEYQAAYQDEPLLSVTDLFPGSPKKPTGPKPITPAKPKPAPAPVAPPSTESGKALAGIYERAASATDADIEAARSHVKGLSGDEVQRVAAAMRMVGKATRNDLLKLITDRRAAAVRSRL